MLAASILQKPARAVSVFLAEVEALSLRPWRSDHLLDRY